MTIDTNKETQIWNSIKPVPVSDGDPIKERARIWSLPIHQLIIDDIIGYRLDDPQFFGTKKDEERRIYRVNIWTDVRTRRMIAQISKPYQINGIYPPSILYLTVQHGYYLELMDNRNTLQEITRLKNIIDLSGNADLKDECESMPRTTISLRYPGRQRGKVAFKMPHQQILKQESELRGVSDSTYAIITSIYSGMTSPVSPKECLEYGMELIERYKERLDDRVRNLTRLVNRTNNK
jgi:hypothetical protein